jgi:hypothetical protein
MADKEAGNQKVFRKSFKNYDLEIDKGKIYTVIVVIVGLILFMLFMFYLAGIFK